MTTAQWLDLPAEQVAVADAAIRFRRLGPRGAPPVLLVHGGAAHAGWWIDVAPVLAQARDVVVPELSGHGDSDHRASYSAAQWAAEVAAVVDRIGSGPVHLVGHSMGGMVALLAAADHRTAVRSLLVVDSAVVRKPAVRRPLSRQVRFYSSHAEGMANFRLRPRGTVADAATLARIAAAGLRETPEGWRWKFDPYASQPLSRDELHAAIPRIRCRVEFLYGEHSELVDEATVDQLAAMLGRDVPRRVAPGAYHHVPIDAPLETVDAIERSIRESDAA